MGSSNFCFPTAVVMSVCTELGGWPGCFVWLIGACLIFFALCTIYWWSHRQRRCLGESNLSMSLLENADNIAINKTSAVSSTSSLYESEPLGMTVCRRTATHGDVHGIFRRRERRQSTVGPQMGGSNLQHPNIELIFTPSDATLHSLFVAFSASAVKNITVDRESFSEANDPIQTASYWTSGLIGDPCHAIEVEVLDSGNSSSNFVFVASPDIFASLYCDLTEELLYRSHVSERIKPDPKWLNTSLLLSEPLAHLLSHFMPVHCQLETGPWQMLYSLSRDGASIQTFYCNTCRRGPNVVLVRTSKGDVIGAFAPVSWEPPVGSPTAKLRNHNHLHYTGTGEAFLFRLTPAFQVFSWTQSNPYFMLADHESISFGGGGRFSGMWLDKSFETGTSGYCPTFNNPPLTGQQRNGVVFSTSDEERFDIVEVQCWAVAADKPSARA